jgi:hypothetical protein
MFLSQIRPDSISDRRHCLASGEEAGRLEGVTSQIGLDEY